jgi:hypothetical protein
MKASRRPRRDVDIILAIHLIGLCMNLSAICMAAAQDYTATSLLAEKQAELNTFVRAVEANARNCGTITPRNHFHPFSLPTCMSSLFFFNFLIFFACRNFVGIQ